VNRSPSGNIQNKPHAAEKSYASTAQSGKNSAEQLNFFAFFLLLLFFLGKQKEK
jgi:hypothetical protein